MCLYTHHCVLRNLSHQRPLILFHKLGRRGGGPLCALVEGGRLTRTQHNKRGRVKQLHATHAQQTHSAERETHMYDEWRRRENTADEIPFGQACVGYNGEYQIGMQPSCGFLKRAVLCFTQMSGTEYTSSDIQQQNETIAPTAHTAARHVAHVRQCAR